tara:strand:- start:994 stop:1554 length:561 start_codon:yes stop_codon:yes gene_type:complete
MLHLSTQDVVSSIEKSPLLIKEGIYYQHFNEFFGMEVLNELEIHNLKCTKLERQHNKPRLRVDYNETIMKKLKIFFSSTKITSALGSKFKTDLKFESVDIWFDYEGYKLFPHLDDSRIKLALQIYLGEGDNVGTCIFNSTNEVIDTFKYKYNCGYALLNNSVSLHGTTGTVSENNNLRKSMYVRYC